MKIVKIFGLVVAVHAAVFLLIFAIPGCRSSARKASAGAQRPAGRADSAVAPADVPEMPSYDSHGSSSRRSRTPHRTITHVHTAETTSPHSSNQWLPAV